MDHILEYVYPESSNGTHFLDFAFRKFIIANKRPIDFNNDQDCLATLDSTWSNAEDMLYDWIEFKICFYLDAYNKRIDLNSDDDLLLLFGTRWVDFNEAMRGMIGVVESGIDVNVELEYIYCQ